MEEGSHLMGSHWHEKVWYAMFEDRALPLYSMSMKSVFIDTKRVHDEIQIIQSGYRF